MIAGAAVKIGDDVYTAPPGGGTCPHRRGFTKTRHCCVYSNNEAKMMPRIKGGEKHTQGFVTDTGEFLDRYEAVPHAVASGQLAEGTTDMLVSEDLW